MKKTFTSLILILTLLFCNPISASYTSQENKINVMYMKNATTLSRITDFFTGNEDIYTFYDMNGNNVTDTAKSRLLKLYYANDVDRLEEYLDSFSLIVKTEVEKTPSSRAIGDYNYEMKATFIGRASTQHGYSTAYEFKMICKYTGNAVLGVIYSAERPTFENPMRLYDYADNGTVPYITATPADTPIITHYPGTATVSFRAVVKMEQRDEGGTNFLEAYPDIVCATVFGL